MTRRLGPVALCLLGVCATVAPARAQPSTIAPATATLEPPPSFVTLHPIDGYPRASLELAYSHLDGGPELLRSQLHAQYAHPVGGVRLGGWAKLVLTRLALDDTEDEGGLGNVELGGYVALRRSFDIVAGVGIGLPTAERDNFANLFASHARLIDRSLIAPEQITVRPRVALANRTERYTWRIDAGVDVMLNVDDDVDSDGEALVVFGGGAGLFAGPVVVSIELVNTAWLTEGDGLGERLSHTLGIGCRLWPYPVQPALGLGLPLDDEPDAPILTLAVEGVLR